MRDFLPEDLRRREYVIGVIRDVYERYGFEPIETPAVENIETLLGKAGEESNKLIFKILKRGDHEGTGEADLALRYDLTVPLARVVAEYQAKLPKFFKRYQIQPVWRADRPARGRFREFCQCDVDIVGSASLVVEAELLAAATDVLTQLRFQDFTFHLNHRQVLSGLLYAAGVPESKHADVLVALDKLDKIGSKGVAVEFAQLDVAEAATPLLSMLAGISERSGELLRQWRVSGEGTALKDWNISIIGQLTHFVGGYDQGRTAIKQLAEVLDLSRTTSAAPHVLLDPSLARGLSYYTGAIMEITVPDLPGSLGGGGRYDNLVGMFLGRHIPACGFSLGLERILVVMTERNMFPESVVRGSSDVMITQWSEETRAEALEFAATLRAAGLRVDVYPEVDKIGKQFKYASTRQVPFVVVLGDEERARGEATIKDMRSGAQQAVNRQEAAAHIRKTLDG